MRARFFCASHIFSSMSMIQVGSQWSSPLHLADWSASDFYFAATQCRCFEFVHCDSATDPSVNYCSIKHWLRSRTSWSSVRKRQPTLLLRHLETLRNISMLNISRQSNSVQVACRREFVTHCDTFTMDWRNFLHKTSSPREPLKEASLLCANSLDIRHRAAWRMLKLWYSVQLQLKKPEEISYVASFLSLSPLQP